MADYSRDFQLSYGADCSSCTIAFYAFDVPNSVTVFGIECGEKTEKLLLEIRRRCLEYHLLWSFSLEHSDISRLNALETLIPVDERTSSLLEAMIAFNRLEPSFDFTVGPVSYLWKHAEQLPSDDEICCALEHVGASKVSLEAGNVIKADPLVRIDVGGAAKGFIADDVATLLREAGVQSADVDLGGNLFMVGEHPTGRPWRVAVHVPEGIEAKSPMLDVRDRSVVTSGTYERFVEIEGRRFHHIIDASTGRPASSDLVSATVVAASSLEADMLATTALMAGSTGLEALRARHPDTLIVVITNEGQIL